MYATKSILKSMLGETSYDPHAPEALRKRTKLARELERLREQVESGKLPAQAALIHYCHQAKITEAVARYNGTGQYLEAAEKPQKLLTVAPFVENSQTKKIELRWWEILWISLRFLFTPHRD